MLKHFKESNFYECKYKSVPSADGNNCTSIMYVVKCFDDAILAFIDFDFYVCPIFRDWDTQCEYVTEFFQNNGYKSLHLCFKANNPILDYNYADTILDCLEYHLGGNYEDCTE